MRGAIALPGSKTTPRREGSCRNLRDLASGRTVPVPCRSAPGRRGAEAGDERGRGVGPHHSSEEAAERGWATGGGSGGAKGWDQGECGAATHIPDAEPETCDPGAEPRTAARQRKQERFTALLHHVNVDTLRLAFYALRRAAAAGVDGVTWQDYETELEPRLEDLAGRVHRGAYAPQPSRRVYIPKADGRQRPPRVKPVG
jgi:hypothetical protein